MKNKNKQTTRKSNEFTATARHILCCVESFAVNWNIKKNKSYHKKEDC